MRTSSGAAELPVPDLYRAEHAHDWNYHPDEHRTLEAAVEWRRAHRLTAAGSDPLSVRLLLVDLQRDFCFPEGSLFVSGRGGRGAVEDSDRIARFIYRELGAITEVLCTLDTHHPFQIFFPAFWLDESDRPPPPHLEISAGDIRSGRFRPNPHLAPWLAAGDEEWLQRQVLFYARQLEMGGRYRLYLWPPHCILGSDGHTLAGVIHEARIFHAFARHSLGHMEVKGGNPLTEHYSVLAPEVTERHDGGTLAEPNPAFLRTLLDSDVLIVAGQAASHCVRYTVEDLLSRIREIDERLAGRIYLLEDCMSPVAVPDPERPGSFLFDFTEATEAALRRFAAAGVHLVRSTTPIASWPEIPPVLAGG